MNTDRDAVLKIIKDKEVTRTYASGNEEKFYKALVNVSEGKTLVQSASSAGISTGEFLKYLTNHIRITEINHLCRIAMEAHIPEVYGQLLSAIRRGSIQAIKLFLEFLELMPRIEASTPAPNINTYNTVIVTESKKILDEAEELGLNIPENTRKRLEAKLSGEAIPPVVEVVEEKV